LLEAFDFQTFAYIVREVVAPEVFAHMISLDRGMDREYIVENILYDPRAWKYGSLVQTTVLGELWKGLGLEMPEQTGIERKASAGEAVVVAAVVAAAAVVVLPA
jgi:hypothetical protein